MRLSVNRLVPLAAFAFLPACGTIGGGEPASAPAIATSGPAADYPVVLGEPFTIGSTTYTPTDALNYDAVGYASVSDDPVTRVTASHKTLPLPSYAEVTHLDTGRTILVRIETRGPMDNGLLAEMSQGAAIQLGIGPGQRAPVRVRRVNPPEPERAMLRGGGEAPLRMETPDALLKVLKRKLEAEEPLGGPASKGMPAPEPSPGPAPLPSPVPVDVDPPAAPGTVAEPETAPPLTPAPEPVAGDYIVQVAAFSTQARAESAAKALGGFVTRPGRYWYVRLGPFASKADAGGALEQARGKGYSDARIQRAD